jgi:hypothetical protein
MVLLILLSVIPVSADTNITNSQLAWEDENWLFASWSEKTDVSNAWVDNSGNLHMLLREIGGTYKGALFENTRTTGYGRYTWVTASPTLNLERDSTFGLFTYLNDFSELDIEVNQWYEDDAHLYYCIQPASTDYHPENLSKGVYDNSTFLNESCIVYSIEWMPDYVYYSARLPDNTLIFDWNYTNSENIPAVNHTVCFDLLPLGGTSGPSSGEPIEVILSSYNYTTMQDVLNETQPEEPDPEEPEPEEPNGSWIEPPNAYYVYSVENKTVSFLDMSNGDPSKFLWDFGDGSISFEQNATHTYAGNGWYDVELRTKNADGYERYKSVIEVRD